MENKRKIYINELKRKPQDFQFYMHQFVEAGIRAGFTVMKVHSSPKRLFRRIMPIILSIINFSNLYKLRSKHLVTTSRGDGILEAAYPYYLSCHIIPMLWDTWPKEQDWLFKDLRRLKCPLVMVTARQMAVRIEKELKIKTLWVPEGIDIQGFIKGNTLSARPIDVYELGRQHTRYHSIIEKAINQRSVKTWKGNVYGEDGTLKTLACETTEQLKETLANSKIVVCFPKIDTANSKESGNIETLTQRYWEVMLSGSLLIGRAPKELTDFIGYNPVVEVNWNEPGKQIADILGNISVYQSLVDKNFDTAYKMASWDSRMNMIKTFIEDNLNI